MLGCNSQAQDHQALNYFLSDDHSRQTTLRRQRKDRLLMGTRQELKDQPQLLTRSHLILSISSLFLFYFMVYLLSSLSLTICIYLLSSICCRSYLHFLFSYLQFSFSYILVSLPHGFMVFPFISCLSITGTHLL